MNLKKFRQYEYAIRKVNESFGGAYYLIKCNREIKYLNAVLRDRSMCYKKSIELIQKNNFMDGKPPQKNCIADFVACTIAAKSQKFYSFGSSYKLLNKYHPKIKDVLNKKLGSIGETSEKTGSKNVIGKCAEVKAANALLVNDNSCFIEAIEFAAAIRPRTMETIDRCNNCVCVFG